MKRENFKADREIKHIIDRGPKVRITEFSLETMQARTQCSNILTTKSKIFANLQFCIP